MIFVNTLADANNLIVITKDSDFRNSYFIRKTPKKLIKINLGNISNTDLIKIFTEIIDTIVKIDSLPHFLVEIEKNYYNLITE